MCMPSRSRSDCGFMSYLAGVLSADCVAGAVADCCGWFTPAKAGTVSRDKATSERSRFFIVNLLWRISIRVFGIRILRFGLSVRGQWRRKAHFYCCFCTSPGDAAVWLRRGKDEMSSPEIRISVVDGEKKPKARGKRFRAGQEDGIQERSFVASLLWM